MYVHTSFVTANTANGTVVMPGYGGTADLSGAVWFTWDDDNLYLAFAAQSSPDRALPLEQSLIGGSDRAKYSEEADVSPATASADFRRLLDAGLVQQTGKGRSTRYRASSRLREAVH